MSMHHIFAKRGRRRPWWNALFVTTLFISGSICVIVEQYNGQNTWIDFRNYPGGPAGYLFATQYQILNTVGNVASVVTLMVSNALLVRLRFLVPRHHS
jgi:hypothetical protein